MDYIRMNNEERTQLCDKVKSKIRELFDWFETKPYIELIGFSDLKTREQLDNIEVVELVSYLLNASQKTIKVKCDYTNEFFEGDNRSGKYFIWGESRIYENLENIISMKPSQSFTYEYEYDESDEPADYSNELISHLTIGDINMYRGTFSYMGIANEESADVGAPLEVMELFNEVMIRYIDEDDSVWKKHIAASYRLYDGKSYKLAFLTAFIALDTLIEFLNDRIKDVYYLHVNDTIDYSLKNYNENHWNAIDIMRENVLRSEAYDRLNRLENPYRKLIGQKMETILKFTHEWSKQNCDSYVTKYSLFEKIRNSLAHGNDYQKEEIALHPCFQLYEDKETSGINFDRLYVDLVLSICKFIEILRA